MSGSSLKDKTRRGLFWTFVNQFATYGVQFVIGIFMARQLSPSDYGITALPAVFMAVAAVFIDSGFAQAMIRKPELKEEDLSTSFYYSLLVGLICYIIIYFSSSWIAEFYKEPILEQLIHVTALIFFISPLTTPQTIILQRKLDFRTPTIINVLCIFIQGFIGLSLAYTGWGIWALVLSGLAKSIANCFLCWLAVRWRPKTGWCKESFKYLWGFGNKMVGSKLLDRLYINIVPVFVGKYFSPADLGVYNRAEKYAMLPSQNLSGVIQQVTFPVLSKVQNDNEKLRYGYRTLIRTTAFIIFPIMTLLSALSKPLIILMITEKWIDCVPLLQIMCWTMMWYPIHSLNLNVLMVRGRSDLFLRLEIIKKIFGICMLAICLPKGLIVVCIGSFVSSMFSLIINTHYTGKIIGVGYFMQLMDIFPTIVLCIISFISAYCCTCFFENSLQQVLYGGFIGTTLYIVLAYVFKFNQLKEIKYMFSKNV